MEKAKVRALNYASPLEGIAEKFHANSKLLVLLNPGKTFDKAGEEILVPDVLTPVPPKASSVIVEGSERSVRVLDARGKILAYYPASIGSERDPLPIGTWKILGKKFNPEFHYNPDLFWDAGDPGQGDAASGAEESCRVGLDHAFKRALRYRRDARTFTHWTHPIAWLHTADKLGRRRTRTDGGAGHAGNSQGAQGVAGYLT